MSRNRNFRNGAEMKTAGATTHEMLKEREGVWARMTELANKTQQTADEGREYDALETVLNSFDEPLKDYDERFRNAQMRGVIAAGLEDAVPYRRNAPLASGQTVSGFVNAMGHQTPDEVNDALKDESRDLNLGKYLKGAFTGDWSNAEPERILMALSGSTAGAGGVMLPTILTSRIIDLARNKTRVLEAGAQTVPMANRTVDVARWLTDPTLSWRTENAAIAETDPTMDKITLAAKSLAAVTKVSRELVEDTDIENQLEAAFGSALAISVDTAALYGTGAAGQPTGVKNTAAVTKTALAANGASPTWAALVNSVGRLRDVNEEPTAQITSDRTLRSLALIAATDGQYVAPPTYLDGVDRYTTAQVPNTLTVGTSSDTADVFTADWTQLLIGVRTELQITLLTERYMPDAGQYGFVAWWRGDIAVARPKAFDVVTGVRA